MNPFFSFGEINSMRPSTIVYCFFLLIYSHISYAQTKSATKIIGKVLQAGTTTSLEFATASLFKSVDSTIVTGAMTDIDGKFEIEAIPGRYYLVVDFIGYDSKKQTAVDIKPGQANLDLGNIALTQSGMELEEVNIVAEKSETNFALDKRVFNVGKDLTNKGGTAQDVLDNVPSVTVDVEGNVSLRGSGNVRILVDGKPSGLVGVSSTNGLRSIPANLIDRVEVITNPSAKYEAEGMTGIINIVLKKDNKPGYNGSFDVSGGWPANGGISANMNYRHRKLNYFVNYGLNYNSGPSVGYNYLENIGLDTINATLTDRNGTRNRLANSVRAGAEYSLSKTETLTGAFSYRYSTGDNISTIQYFDDIFLKSESHSRELVQRSALTERIEKETELEPNIELSFDYVKKYNDKGKELKVILQGNQSEDKELSDFTNRNYLDGIFVNGSEYTQRAESSEGQQSVLIQADYVLPFNKDNKAEFGLRSAYRNIGNKYLVEDFVGDAWIRDDNFSNDFDYNEFIHAAYGIYGAKKGKWSYQGGLRWEISDFTTELLDTKKVNPRLYNNLFPSGHINYTFPGDNQVQASYSRRIQRPGFRDLNPFFTFADNRNIFTGNPDLNPEFTNAFEISHIKYWGSGNIGTTLFYRKTTDIIQRVTIFNPDGTNTTQPLNLAAADNMGVEFLWAYSPVKILKLDGNLNLFRQIIEGEFAGEDLGVDTYSWFGRIGAKMAVAKNHDLQLRLNYRAPVDIPQGRQREQYVVDFAYSFDFLSKKQASFTLSWRDIFNQRRRNAELISDEIYQRTDFQFRRSPIVATFSYRLNMKKERKKERQGGEEGGEF